MFNPVAKNRTVFPYFKDRGEHADTQTYLNIDQKSMGNYSIKGDFYDSDGGIGAHRTI
jgi:hypothetical protein